MESQDYLTPNVNSSLHPPVLDSLGFRCDNSFSQDSSDLDEDKCYLLEIQQLKRENNFLKKKLAELSKKPRASLQTVKKRSPSIYGASSQKHLEEPSRNYIVGFIEEVMKLLENFSSLFRIEFKTNLEQQLDKQNAAFNDLTTQKTGQIHHRLTRILLQPETKKYEQVLEMFSGYYRENEERNRNIRQRVEGLTTETMELAKRMAESIVQREQAKRSMKGSQLVMLRTPEEHFREECLNSSVIKSTCTDENFQFRSCNMDAVKEKVFLNIF